jgi:hypothetical protein
MYTVWSCKRSFFYLNICNKQRTQKHKKCRMVALVHPQKAHNSVSTSLHLYTTSLHLYTTSLHLYTTSLHLYTTSLHLYTTSLHLNTTSLHLYTTSLHLYTTSLHLYTTSLHLYTTSLHLYTTSLHLYTTSLHLYKNVFVGMVLWRSLYWNIFNVLSRYSHLIKCKQMLEDHI